MKTGNYHLFYCTNIHAGETWEEIFSQLKENVPAVKKEFPNCEWFGLGLRLGSAAANDLIKPENINAFKLWLLENRCYVKALNGFPYGGFHHTQVKDNVYKPDWTTNERVIYTEQLIKVMEQLMNENTVAGISTVPLSYKPWMINSCNTTDVFEACTVNLVKCVQLLYNIRQRTGKIIHIDIEPEPFCLLETTHETVDYFKNYLFTYGAEVLSNTYTISNEAAVAILKDHIRICFDVCHFAVEFENVQQALQTFKTEEIKIGRIQISAALKLLTYSNHERGLLYQRYSEFAESTYLHQTIVRDSKNHLHRYSDLPEALQHFNNEDFIEWRTHYHVPVFMDSYNELHSTQDEILKTLEFIKRENVTELLEVETYTWEVLPHHERLSVKDSIVRELKWVMAQL